MAEFNLEDLKKIKKQSEVMDFLIEHEIIKEKKFLNQLAYEKEMSKLQSELVRLQSQIVDKNQRVLIVFEGRDAAGKGGTIKRIAQNLNPKKYRVIALSKPTEEEQSQWYFQRYIKHLPNKGEIVFFDRSWYNRAVVEPVFGFCTEEQHQLFMEEVNAVEKRFINDGIILIKMFLDISKDEQKKRLDKRKNDPLKSWKLGDLDRQALEKWNNYSYYIKKMLNNTATDQLHWVEIRTDNKKEARLESIKYLISKIPHFVSTEKINIDKKIVIIHK